MPAAMDSSEAAMGPPMQPPMNSEDPPATSMMESATVRVGFHDILARFLRPVEGSARDDAEEARRDEGGACGHWTRYIAQNINVPALRAPPEGSESIFRAHLWEQSPTTPPPHPTVHRPKKVALGAQKVRRKIKRERRKIELAAALVRERPEYVPHQGGTRRFRCKVIVERTPLAELR